MTSHADRRRLPSTSTNTDAEPIRILLADDDANYRAYIAALARRLGFIVNFAGDGADAIEQLERAPYDIAVIDHDMPRVNGIGVVAHMRTTEALKCVYTVMLTSHDDVATKLSALNAGFDDFMTKSAAEVELVAKLIAARRVAVRQRTLDAAVRELYGLATRDPLTGVFNRRFFLLEIERILAAGSPVTLLLFDLDGFKQINDTYGHLAGDRILRDVGALFLRNTRPEDLIARYGGDEFVMALADMSLVDVDRVVARLTADIAALQWSAGGEAFGIGITTGAASSALIVQPTIEMLLDAADRDLYKNKWQRKHPEARPELYEYPVNDRRVDLVMPLPQAVLEIAADGAEVTPRAAVPPTNRPRA